MQYQATEKYLRISTRKARLIADAIRSMPVARALVHVSIMSKDGGKFFKKSIESAVANAKTKGQTNVDALRFVQIIVSQGPAMKRWHAVSKGTAHAYKKRMTHITIVLTDETDTMKGKIVQKGVKMNAR